MVPVAAGRSRPIARACITITGIVQGVGFRPFVFRLANELGLTGWVANNASGVIIEAQSTEERLAHFQRRLQTEAPPLAAIVSCSRHAMEDVEGEASFVIHASSSCGERTAQIPPDAAICPDCLRELNDPADRRFRYPFINCTNCGPRFTIITALPYDRTSTTMANFTMCRECLAEYHDPANRRFHAQPNACKVCGPETRLLEKDGTHVCAADDAINDSTALLAEGHILAVKGIGGYHLAADAMNDNAVRLLRQRKKRDEKPFAVMVADMRSARELAMIGEQEERLLTAPEAPIVIVRKRTDCPLSPLVAPGNGWLGLMLPYTPLHHLLFSVPSSRSEALGSAPRTSNQEPTTVNRQPITALVMTSANHSDEPVVYSDADALRRLSGIADHFLTHDRPIHTGSDDSVMRVFQDRPLFYRRSRGYAPRPVRLPFQVPPLLAVGAELKSAVCLAADNQAFLSQHIGDLQNSATSDAFRHITELLESSLDIRPELAACDRHPDYISSMYARESGLPLVEVQHHHAHMAACMAENGLEGDVIGIILDGTGYGDDGTIWGGEFLVGSYDRFQRAGHFRPLPLPGGDTAVMEPWRMTLSCLHGSLGEAAFSLEHPIIASRSDLEKELLAAMLARGINSPLSSSCGRLFDAAAALLGVRQKVSYDGQAAIELEALAETFAVDNRTSDRTAELPYSLNNTEGEPFQLDFTPLFPAMLDAMASGMQPAEAAFRFHEALAGGALAACSRIAAATGLKRVVLSGGVFQNRLLSEMIYTPLTREGLQVFTHRLVPANDGGIALGQAAIAGRRKP